jgi:ATP-dependent helicase HrpB
VLVGGRGVRLADDSAVTDDALFVAVDVAAGRRGAHSESVVRLASGLDRGWLPDGGITLERAVFFDPEREKVRCLERTRYLDLHLEERPAGTPEAGAAAGALEEAARRDPERALGLDLPRRAGVLARWRFLREAMPELGLPDPNAVLVDDVLPLLCTGRSSFAELRAAKVLGTLLGLLPHPVRAALDREAPERLVLPSGHGARVQYAADGPPVLAARIQDLFGWAETPRVAAGRVPLTLHLLAPNGRPQQVTQDLRSFWDNTYPEVRKELRARYPKHAWPEKP